MPFIEIVNPLYRLTKGERRILIRAFRLSRDGRADFVLKPGVSGRTVAAAVPVIEKLRRMRRLPFPVPPRPADWRVWQLRQAGWKFEALAADDSPVRRSLSRGSTSGSRRVLAMRAHRRVEDFRRRVPAWWFRVMTPP